MKVLCIEGKSKLKDSDYFIDPNFIKQLPKDIFLCYSIQFKGQAEAMKKALEKARINIRGFQQVLGCTKLKVNPAYAILLVGQGKFHSNNLAMQNRQPIIIYSNGSSIQVSPRDIEELKKRQEAAFSKFLHYNNIGILVSTKPGQEKLSQAEELKKKIAKKYPEKQVYIFLADSVNSREFENFGIDFFINTACPGILGDSPKIGNADDIIGFLE